MNVVALNQTYGSSRIQWWDDKKTVALVKRTAAKDCNEDEFNQFVAVCRDLGLSPLRKQIYAFVFNKTDPEKRQMTLVVGIDGGRSVAARSGNYRPDDKPPHWEISEAAKDELTNPLGIVSCTVGVYHRPTRADPFERITATVFWDEFAPIVNTADNDDYEWVDTGEVHPQGTRNAGKPKRVRRLKEGRRANVSARLDPKKEQWIRMPRHKLALCAEMQALRRGWPEDMSRLYVEEETDRHASTIDGEFEVLSPSEMVVAADTEARMDRLGGPALLAALGEAGALIRVPHGQFYDRMIEATEGRPPAEVAAIVERNAAAINEFWAHNKNDALALKKELETRSGSPARRNDQAGDTPASAASPQPGEKNSGGAAPSLSDRPAIDMHAALARDIDQLSSMSDCLHWSTGAAAKIAQLPKNMQDDLNTKFQDRQSKLGGK